MVGDVAGARSARPLRRCADEQRAWPALEPEPDTLYVVLLPAAVAGEQLAASGAACASFDLGRICSTNRAGIDGAIRAGIARN